MGSEMCIRDRVMSAYTRLKENGVSDNEICSIMTFADKQKLGDQVLNLPGPDREATNALRMGFKGEVMGVPTLFTQQLPTLTLGNDTTGVNVDGATQNVNYQDVANSTAPGRYKTQTLNLQGFTANTGTLNAGTVFTIDGIYAWDNRQGGRLDYLQEFTVVQGGTADANGDIAAVIYPALIVPASGAGDNPNINSAHATVSAAPADTAAITFKGAADEVVRPRVMLKKSAIEVGCVDMVKPYTGESMRRSLPNLPLSVRMWKHSEFDTAAGAAHHKCRFDIALNADIRCRDEAVRFNGS